MGEGELTSKFIDKAPDRKESGVERLFALAKSLLHLRRGQSWMRDCNIILAQEEERTEIKEDGLTQGRNDLWLFCLLAQHISLGH